MPFLAPVVSGAGNFLRIQLCYLSNSLHNFLVSPQITKINKTLCVTTFVTTMSEGEVDLETLIQTMSPRLYPDVYVFLSLHHNDSVPKLVTDSSVFTFRETEGRTFVLPRATVETLGYTQYEYTCRMVTLEVHSSLAAVGFLAVILRHLADNNVSVNVASGFYHDHLFVQEGEEELVMDLLRQLSQSVTESSEEEEDTDHADSNVSDENNSGEESQAPVIANEGSDQEKETETEVRKNHDIVVVFSDSDHDD